jgi:hypothetical protein
MDTGICGGKDMKERDSLEDLGLDMRITTKWILKMVWHGMDWINLSTYSGKWGPWWRW